MNNISLISYIHIFLGLSYIYNAEPWSGVTPFEYGIYLYIKRI
nr:hypothetical protein [uncultured Mediterranean phage uvMED]